MSYPYKDDREPVVTLGKVLKTLFFIAMFVAGWAFVQWVINSNARHTEVVNTRVCIQSTQGMCGLDCNSHKCEQYVPCTVCLKYDKEY